MSTILVDHAPVSIASGQQIFGPVNVPVGTNWFKISLDRSTTATPTFWPNTATKIDAQILIAKDGVTFDFPVGEMTAGGGIITGIGPNSGVQVVASTVGGPDAPFVPPSQSGWKAQAIVSVISGPLVSQLTVEVG